MTLITQLFIIVVAIMMIIVILLLIKELLRLKPGVCQCGHFRCRHTEGKHGCCVMENALTRCNCQVYVYDRYFDNDDDDDDDDDDNMDEPEPINPDVRELERLFKK